MNRIVITVLALVICITGFAQPSFLDVQKTNARFAAAVKQKEDTLQKQFAAAGLQWPPKEIYLRSFKYDSQLEVWVRNSDNEQFKLFKSYRICALAGSFGPKRLEGDYQVPEGFYHINKFDPRSEYHFALGINYPNVSDKIVSDSMNQNPGGGILIHGSCVTVGCIPIMDEPIEEVYIIAANAKSNGQDFIPVHIFPMRYSNSKSMDFFNKTVKDDDGIKHFAAQLKLVYDYFEEHKKLPLICIDKKGNYTIM
jgi:murein L,D-transpeptidase YafK